MDKSFDLTPLVDSLSNSFAAQNATGPEAEALCLAARISRRILEGQEVTLP